MAKRRKNGPKTSFTSKAINTVFAVIAATPLIDNLRRNVPIQNWNGIGAQALEDFTGFDTSGGFSYARLVKGYGPIIAAIVGKRLIKRALKGKMLF